MKWMKLDGTGIVGCIQTNLSMSQQQSKESISNHNKYTIVRVYSNCNIQSFHNNNILTKLTDFSFDSSFAVLYPSHFWHISQS